MASCWHTSTYTLTRNLPLDLLSSTQVKKNKPYIFNLKRVTCFFFYSNDIVLILVFLLRYITRLFRLIELMTTRGGDEKCSRSKLDRERHQSMALRFSTPVCTSNDSLNNLSLVLFFRFFLSFVRHIFDERSRKFWMFDATTRSVWKKKETSERTNEPASFCLYSSYSRRTIVYIYFSFPNDQIGRRWTSNIVPLFVS